MISRGTYELQQSLSKSEKPREIFEYNHFIHYKVELFDGKIVFFFFSTQIHAYVFEVTLVRVIKKLGVYFRFGLC